MMQVVEELNTLRLDVLDQDWVQGIFYSEFLEFGEFPSEYESILESLEIPTVFKSIMRSVDTWLTSEDDYEEKSWATLSHHVEHQKLLAILAYYIDYGTKNVVTKEYRNNALLASRVYYKLLAVPGFKAYHIYHSQLFAHSLACLGFPKKLGDNEDKYYNTKELTREVNSIIKELRFFVLDLRSIIDSLQLNPSDMNFEDILSNLVDITGGAIVNKLDVDKIELTNISGVIYGIIKILLCNANGEPNAQAITLLFKCILPKLLAASVDTKNANNLVRASYVTYSGLLLSQYRKLALPGFTILIEHLCYSYDGLERAEVRQARVSLVAGMMSLLPRKSYRSVTKWLLKLSTTAKVSHRQIALEMLSKLLQNEGEEEKPQELDQTQVDQTENTETSNEQTSKEGEQTCQEGEQASKEVNLQTQSEGENQPEVPPTKVPTEDETSQDTLDNPDTTEEEIVGILRHQVHTAPHKEILRAVYERVNDSSSSLRTRAFHVLTECLESNHEPMRQAIQELNGAGAVSRLMAVAARGVVDERAAVRRAALALVHRSLTASHAPPEPHDLGILVGLCRDASIIVRSGAISALGELVLQRPYEAVFDAFLSGPMRQLSDPETKVQDQVVKLVQELLIDRLKKYVVGSCEDLVPWMFLASVTRHNMRRHLLKACGMLAKNNKSISHRLVDMLSTHLGALSDERDLYTLVMLTCVAKHVDYNNIDFALDYYYKISDDPTARGRDPRLLALALELLEAWSPWLRLAARTQLRTHLVRRLATADDDGCRLACVTLAARLDPLDLTWATEMMQLSERAATNSVESGEWVRAADLSLVAPTPPSPRLVQLLLGAVNSPPPEWTTICRGEAVAALGRLCLRSRDTAAAAARPLAALLQDNTAPLAPRMNALLSLTDICIRHTSIVEPLLGCMCECLSAHCAPALRRAAARALTRLLLSQFLRLRTPLYYRYCALLADEDHDVREPAEYYVTCCLTPDTIYHHFVDCIIHYNTEDIEPGISFDARQLIYDVMLQRLSLVQKLNLQCRVAREVLTHAADLTDEGDGDLPPALAAALLDTITLLCGPRMKLPKKPQRDGDAGDMDDLQERITTNIVSHKMKRTVAEVVVPAVLRLHARLRSKGGQVVAYLVRIANELLSDYRHEIEELIENDEELVESVRQFQETIGTEPSFGNSRNLVTASTGAEPETPRAPRKRPQRPAARSPHRKRALRI